jgi:hypothetical protein
MLLVGDGLIMADADKEFICNIKGHDWKDPIITGNFNETIVIAKCKICDKEEEHKIPYKNPKPF